MPIKCGEIFSHTSQATITEPDGKAAVRGATEAAMIEGLRYAASVCAAIDDPTAGKCDHVRLLSLVSVTVTCTAAKAKIPDGSGGTREVPAVEAEVLFDAKYRCFKERNLPPGDAETFESFPCGTVYEVQIDAEAGVTQVAANLRADGAAAAVCKKMQTCTTLSRVSGVAKANGTGWVFKYKCVTPPPGAASD